MTGNAIRKVKERWLQQTNLCTQVYQTAVTSILKVDRFMDRPTTQNRGGRAEDDLRRVLSMTSSWVNRSWGGEIAGAASTVVHACRGGADCGSGSALILDWAVAGRAKCGLACRLGRRWHAGRTKASTKEEAGHDGESLTAHARHCGCRANCVLALV